MFLSSCPLYAQYDMKVKIVGSVLDASTGGGLPNVNVFLAGTTLGVASALDGSFVIRNVPLGAYELVVSMVGYERQVLPLQIFQMQDHELTVQLKPTAIQTATVEVTARDPVEWKKQFERFKREFLGETRNAKLCTILNPEGMEFLNRGSMFEVAFHVPIIVENRALGYKLDFFIEEFKTDDMTLQYSAKTKFEELQPESEDEYELWLDNRKRAYRGSRKHFLTALARGTSHQEGFTIRTVPSLWHRTRFSSSSQRIDPAKIVQPTQSELHKKLVFKDYLEVVYRLEPAEPAFRLAVNAQGRPVEMQVSWLQMNLFTVTFDVNGNLFQPIALKCIGYWAFERVADLLPTDYVPE